MKNFEMMGGAVNEGPDGPVSPDMEFGPGGDSPDIGKSKKGGGVGLTTDPEGD